MTRPGVLDMTRRLRQGGLGGLERLRLTVDLAFTASEYTIVLLLLAAALLTAFGQVVARSLGHGLTEADELVRYFVFWLGIWGAGPATRAHKHIAIDALLRVMPLSMRRWLRRGTDLLAAGVAGALCWATVRYIGFLGDERLPSLPLTTAALTWPVAVGFGWVAVRFAVDVLVGVDEEPDLPLGADHADAVTP